MQINRLFEIVYLLMDKKIVTAKELADHFEVSRRTILRDIDTLSAAGIPVYTMQGKGGGIAIHDRYVLNKAVISKEEQKQILFALQSMSATGHIETGSVLGRLQSFFEKNGGDWIEVDFSRWGDRGGDKVKFETLKNAILSEQAVSFYYSSSYGMAADRKVYPLKLIFKSKSWYMQGFCLMKNQYRTFKISRIRNVEILNEPFDSEAFQAPGMEPLAYQSPSLVDIKLRFAPQAAYRMYDEFDEQDIVQNEDSSFTVFLSLSSDYNICDYVLSLGVFVEVLEPQALREEILERIEKIKGIYLQT